MKNLYILGAVLIIGIFIVGYIFSANLYTSQEMVRCATLEGGISTLDIIEEANLDSKYGFKAEVIRLQKTPDILAALSKGDVDLAVIPAEMAAKLIQDGVYITIIAVDMYQNQAILSMRDDIKDVKDLAGKRVGAVLASGTYKMFKAYLKMGYGLDVVEGTGRYPDVVSALNTPPGVILGALERGDVDAIVIWEPIVSKALVSTSAHIVADYPSMWRELGEEGDPVMLVWVARGEFVKDNPGLIDKFLKARRDAAHIWIEDEGFTVSTLVKIYGLDHRVAEKVYERVKINIDDLGDRLIENIRRVWNVAWIGGYLKEDPKWISGNIFYRV